jgi:hypothetical protein
MSFWCVASILSDLDTLVQAIGLKMDALDVPDEIGAQAQRFAQPRKGAAT